MIKECKVIVNNKDALVVDFDETIVQLPKICEVKSKSVYVKFENEKYSVVDKGVYEKSLATNKYKNNNKVTKEIKEEVQETNVDE